MKLTPSEERALLRRVEDRSTTPEDAVLIERLLDEAMAVSPLDAIREMTRALTEGAAVKREWRDQVQPLLERVRDAIEARNALLARELELMQQRQDMAKLRVREILVPLVVGLVGIATTAAAWLFR